MRIRRWYYILVLVLLAVLGFSGLVSSYKPLMQALFLVCLVLFMGGFLRETANKIE